MICELNGMLVYRYQSLWSVFGFYELFHDAKIGFKSDNNRTYAVLETDCVSDKENLVEHLANPETWKFLDNLCRLPSKLKSQKEAKKYNKDDLIKYYSEIFQEEYSKDKDSARALGCDCDENAFFDKSLGLGTLTRRDPQLIGKHVSKNIKLLNKNRNNIESILFSYNWCSDKTGVALSFAPDYDYSKTFRRFKEKGSYPLLSILWLSAWKLFPYIPCRGNSNSPICENLGKGHLKLHFPVFLQPQSKQSFLSWAIGKKDPKILNAVGGQLWTFEKKKDGDCSYFTNPVMV